MANLIERLKKEAAKLAAQGKLVDAAWTADLAHKIENDRKQKHMPSPH